MFNKVILIGNLTRDVELRYTPNGTAIAKFGLATNRTYKDSVTGENKQEVMFIDITVFGRSAEIANQYLAKGRRVLIEGRLVLENWVDNNGQKRSKHSIVAEKIQFMDSVENKNTKTQNPTENPNKATKQNTAESTQEPDINVEEEFPF